MTFVIYCEEKMEIEQEEKKEEEGGEDFVRPKLFDMPKQRKRENWICIKLFAPTIASTRGLKAKDAVGAYCTRCEQRVPFTVTNPSNVVRHMEKMHSDILLQYREKEKEKIKSNSKPDLL
jgi:hypothetical protein